MLTISRTTKELEMPVLHILETIEKLTQINQSSVSRMAQPPLKILCHMEKVPPIAIDNSNDVFSFLVIKSKLYIEGFW